jgi:hypothetical protein
MKENILIIAAVLAFLESYSQSSPLKLWDKRFAGDSTDQLMCMSRNAAGNLFLGGYSNSKSSAEKSQTTKGGNDYWIVKTDSNGNKLWDFTYGTNANDFLYSVVATPDGGCLAGGYTTGGKNNDKSQSSFGSADFWIIRLNANGVKLWDSAYGGNSYEELHHIEPCNDKGFLLAGVSYTGKNGNKKSGNKGDADVWIIKIDSAGRMQWDSTYGGRGFDNCYRAHQTQDGGFLIGATSRSPISGNKTQDSIGNADVWLVKITATGAIQWDKVFGGNKVEELMNFAELSDGGFILPINSNSDTSGNKKVLAKGYLDIWLIRINANGDKIWERAIGGNSDDRIWAITRNQDKGFTLGGYSFSIIGDRAQLNIGGADYWIIKTDSGGKPLWDERFGGRRDDILQDMMIMPSGNMVLGGYSRSGKGFDRTQDTLNNFYDYWITKVRPSKFFITKIDTLLCPNDAVYIHYNTTLSLADTNKLFLQLSDGFSNFQNPVTVGFKMPTKLSTDSILALIPSPAIAAPYYKFRFISTSPKDTSQWSFSTRIKGLAKKPVITRSLDTLTCSNANGVNYQWLKNNIEIPGATQRKYIVSATGYYAVRVDSFNSCGVISDQLAINNVGIDIGKETVKFMVTPNPFDSYIEIKSTDNKSAELQLYDISGRLIIHQFMDNGKIRLSDLNISSGAYILFLKQEGNTFVIKVIKG